MDLSEVVRLALDQIDLTALVLARVDLQRVVAAVLDSMDLTDLVLDRVDLVRIVDEVLAEIDLPEIIRESTGSMAADTVREVRIRGVDADRAVTRVMDRILPRRKDVQP
jgi:hypothetical protein